MSDGKKMVKRISSFEVDQELIKAKRWPSVAWIELNFLKNPVRQWIPRLLQDTGRSHAVDLGDKQVWVSESSLHCFSYDNRYRIIAIRIVESPKLEWLMLAVISCNSILLLFILPDAEIENQTWAHVLDVIALAIYVIESLTKIVAAGLLMGKNTYLKNPWNILDVVVVLSGIADIVLQSANANLGSLRCIRLLRPLKTLSVLPGTRCIVQTLFASVPQLRVLLQLAVFVLGVLAGLGLHLFNDSSWKRCRNKENVIVSDRLCGGFYTCPANSTCVNSAEWLPTAIGQLWTQPEVDYGITGFGNFLQAILTVFQCSTQEGWTDQMYRIMDSTSPVLSVIFFSTTLVLGAFFVFNLILAVLWQQYEANTNADKDADDLFEKDDLDVPWSRAIKMKAEAGEAEKENRQEDTDSWISRRSTGRQIRCPAQRAEVEDEFIKLCETLADLVRLCTNLEIVVKQSLLEKDTSLFVSAGGVNGQLQYQRARLRRLAMSTYFTNVMMCVVAMNAIVLAFDRYPTWKEGEEFMTNLNIVFTFMFTFEVAVKLAGLGIKDFSKNASDVFDFITTMLAIVELWLPDSATGLSSLRTLRLLRVFKLVRGWTSLRILLQVLAKATVMMGHFCFVSLLVLYFFTLLGLQLFGRGQLGSPTTRPRLHFDNGLWSFATVFCIITGENWNTIMFETAFLSQKFFTACIFVLLVLVIGNLVLLNLFLAILGASFQSAREALQDTYRERLKSLVAVCPSETMREQLRILRQRSDDTETLVDEAEKINKAVKKKLQSESCVGEFGPWSLRVIMHPYFDRFILCITFVTSVSLAVHSPNLDPNSTFAHVLSVIDVLCTVIFLLEAMMKLAATGVAQYFSVRWNWIDFFLVVLSIFNFFLSILFFQTSSGLRTLESVRALRTLRPLRLIARNKGLKVVVNCFLSSIPQIVNTLVVTFLLFTIFAILSVNFFKGILYYCQIDAALVDLIDTKADCLRHGGKWVNSDAHFDNVFASFYTLFQASTTEGWTDIMTSVVDGRGIDLQPKRDYNQWAVVFFLVWMLVGGFFILNLFFGVIIDQYNVAKGETEGGVLITKEQKRWIEVQKLVLRYVPLVSRPTGHGNYRKSLLSFVESTTFDNTIYTLIAINSFIALLHHAGQSEDMWLFLEVTQTTFGLLFTIEAILKIIAFGPNGYFMFGGNRFDFFLVMSTLMAIGATLAGLGDSYVATVLKSFRVIRSVRLLHKLPQLRVMFVVAITVLPSIANVCGLVLLLTFMYACLGVNLFGMTYRDKDTALSDFANFENFPNSVLLLLRVSTGEAWYRLMFDCAQKHPNCVDSQTYDDFMKNGARTCGTIIAYPFFISFTLIVAFVVVNLFVGCVLDAFMEQHQDDVFRLIREEHQVFFELWAKTNPCGRRLMRWEYFIELLLEIPIPVGFKNAFPNRMAMTAKTSRVRKFLLSSKIPTWKGQVHLRDCMMLICSRCCAYISLEDKTDFDHMSQIKLEENHVTRTFRARFPEFYPPLHPQHHNHLVMQYNEEPLNADSNLQKDLAFRIIAHWQRTKWRKLRGKMLHASDFTQMLAEEKETKDQKEHSSKRKASVGDFNFIGDSYPGSLPRTEVGALSLTVDGHTVKPSPAKDIKSTRESGQNDNNFMNNINNAVSAMVMDKADDFSRDNVQTGTCTGRSDGNTDPTETIGDYAATLSTPAIVAEQCTGLPIINDGRLAERDDTIQFNMTIAPSNRANRAKVHRDRMADIVHRSGEDDVTVSSSSSARAGTLSDNDVSEVILQVDAERGCDESSDVTRTSHSQLDAYDIFAPLFSFHDGPHGTARSRTSSVFGSGASSVISARSNATIKSVPRLLTPRKHDSDITSTHSSTIPSFPTDCARHTEDCCDDQASKQSLSVLRCLRESRSTGEGACESLVSCEGRVPDALRRGGEWPPLDDDVLDTSPATNGQHGSYATAADSTTSVPPMPSTETAPGREARVSAASNPKLSCTPTAHLSGGRGLTDGGSTSTTSKVSKKRRKKKRATLKKRTRSTGHVEVVEDDALEEEDTYQQRNTYDTSHGAASVDNAVVDPVASNGSPHISYSSFSPCYSSAVRANLSVPRAYATSRHMCSRSGDMSSTASNASSNVLPRSHSVPPPFAVTAPSDSGQRVDKGARKSGIQRPLRASPDLPGDLAARGRGGKDEFTYSCPDCRRNLPRHTLVPCVICQAKPSHVCPCGFGGCRFCLKAITEKRLSHLPRWAAAHYKNSP